jgi:hypothetical protein
MTGFIVYFAMLIFFTYGVTASTLMSFVRMLVALKLGRWGQALVYCPVCAGFWIALALWATGHWPGLVMSGGFDALEAVAVSVAFLHVTTVLLSSRGFLVAPERELEIVEEARGDGGGEES